MNFTDFISAPDEVVFQEAICRRRILLTSDRALATSSVLTLLLALE